MKALIRRNKRLTFTIHMLTAVANLVSTGTLMQTFLATLGLDTGLIYIHSTLTQAANVATLMLGSRWAAPDRVIRRYALITLPYAALFLCYLPLCLRQAPGMGTFVLLLIIGIMQALCTALRTVCTYAMPYLLYPAEDYGPFTAIVGTTSSVFTLLLGALVSRLAATVPFVTLMVWAFALTAALMLLEAGLTLLQRSIIQGDAPAAPAEPREVPTLGETFRHPAFSSLIVANLTRGIASGTIVVFAALAFDLGFSERVTTQMVSIQSAASIISCALIGVLSRRRPPRLEVLLGSLGFLLLPLVFIPNEFVFLSVFAIVFFGRNFVDYGVPILLRRAVPMRIAGSYNAWRLILHNGGAVIASAIAAVIPPAALIGVTVVCSVVSGVGFYRARVLVEAEK